MIQIFIKQINGKTRIVEVEPTINGSDLVNVIYNTAPMWINCGLEKWLTMHAYLCGVKNVNQDKSLAELGIDHESTINENVKIMSTID